VRSPRERAAPTSQPIPMNASDRAPGLTFPTDFPIKVMGRREDGFAQAITEVVRQHAPDFDPATLEMRQSKDGNYLSVTATVRATSREQLDALYRALTAHPMVKVVL
jgi:putative lipoic acid-binding regulatory protein